MKGIFVNPSLPSEDRRRDFLLRQRRNELNEELSDEDSFFLHRQEGRLIRKINGKPDWSWVDDDFADWVQQYEEREAEQRKLQQQRRPQKETNYSQKQWRNSQPLTGGNRPKLSDSQWRVVGRRGRVQEN